MDIQMYAVKKQTLSVIGSKEILQAETRKKSSPALIFVLWFEKKSLPDENSSKKGK